MKSYLADAALLVGFALIVAGVAMWSRPAAFIVAGVMLAFGALRAGAE